MIELDARHVGRHRHQVLGKARRHRRAVGIVHQPFEQCIAEPMRDAADHLARHDQRIDDAAAVVIDHEPLDRHASGLDVDLDLGDVAARGVGRLLRLEIDGGLEPRIAVRGHREAVHADGEIGDLAQRPLHAGCTLHVHCAVLQLEIGLRHLHHLGGDLPDLGSALDGSQMRRVAGVDRRARGERAHAERDASRVARDHRHVVDLDAELICDDLGERGLVALALRRGARRQRDLAGGGDAHRRTLVRPEPRALDGIGEADADVAALLQGGGLPCGEVRIAGCLEREPLAFRVVAAVVRDRPAVAEDDADFVGELLGLDEVAAAHLGPVEAHLGRDEIHHALHREHGLRAAGAAHGRARGLVGVGDDEIEIVGRQHVGSGNGGRRDPRQHEAPGNVGAVVVHEAAAQAEQPRVLVDGDLQIPPLVAFLMRDQEILAPVLHPLHRPPERDARGSDRTVLAIVGALRAEAAADVGRDHTHLRIAEIEHVHERALQSMRALAGDVRGELLGRRVPVDHETAALDEEGSATMLEQALPEHVRGLAERLVDVAVFHRHARDDVVGSARVRGDGRGFDGRPHVGHRGQDLVVDLDEAGRILRDIAAVGDDDGDWLADDAHLLPRQHVLHTDLADGRVRDIERQALLAHHLGQVSPGEHGVNSGMRLGLGGVDAPDGRVGVRRAHQRGMQHSRQRDVVDEAAPAGEEGGVLLALDGSAEPRAALGLPGFRDHGSTLPRGLWRAGWVKVRTSAGLDPAS